jgi:membrane dipeptidase
MTTRRHMIRQSLLTAASTFFVPIINKGRYRMFLQSDDSYSARAVKLVTESLVIDMLIQFKELFKKPDEELQKWLLKPGTFTEENYKHYRDSGINVFALGRDVLNHEDALLFFAKWNGFIGGYSKWLQRIDSAEVLNQMVNSQKIGILLSFQNSNHFRTPDDVDIFLD